MKNKELIILPDSEESAQCKTVSGWVSRNGKFYGNDEVAARWDGSTHKKCDCGEIIEKLSWCKPCNEKSKIDKYNKMPFKEWDEETPLYSEITNEIFYEKEDIEYYLIDHPEETNLRLIICKSLKPQKIDADYFYDSIPDNIDIDSVTSDSFKKAFNALNDIIEKENWGWQEGNFRTEYIPDGNNEIL